ncbi:LOW QUALITY PROTEIN: uncharacterized protein LOC129580730 [Paramacrobiotus metropolitanus]|uniref:LOW QUALITY PROTEIN: uncharacterized protein LOC129580730 n=1 Tax=Paramacrobiotus metropolitanus TaxID=2943436 RepID=UPI002445BD78|nr:LOW QUALITY PROTEIN: uncharacterized protein LOC129580730 [Paramacrobiotus metropolitanus]
MILLIGFWFVIANLAISSLAHLNIVSVTLGGFPSYRYGLTAPTYDIALEDAMTTYPDILRNVSRICFYSIGRTKNCEEEEDLIHNQIGFIYQNLTAMRGTPTIIQTSGCDSVAFTLGDFARELDLPLVISTAGNPELFSDIRFPTVIGFGPADHSMLAHAALRFLQNYNWTTVTLLCARPRDSEKLSPFDKSTCNTLEKHLKAHPLDYDVHILGFNPENTTSYLSILQNIRRQSRVIGFGPADHSMLAHAALRFLQNYNWTTVTLLCARPRDSEKLSPFDKSTCNTLEKHLKAHPLDYDVHILGFNPENTTSYLSILQNIRRQSRVVFLSCAISILRPIMSAAHALGMTKGDYVFLSPQSVAYQRQTKRPWSASDTNDDEILLAYRSLIIYNIMEPDWQKSGVLMDRIAFAAASNYEKTRVNLTEINMLNLAAYEGFMASAQMLNEYLKTEKRQNFSGASFAQMFAERRFSFVTEEVRLSDAVARNPDIIFRRFSYRTKDFEKTWRFIAFLDTLEAVSDLAESWPGDSPPPNRPACGYIDESCDVLKGQRFILSVVIPVVLATLFLSSVGVFFVIRRINSLGQKNLACRWLLDAASFVLYDLSHALRMGLVESLTNPTGVTLKKRITHGYGEK